MLSARGNRSRGSAVTPSVGDQCVRREVTSSRHPPLGGRQASSSPSSSQLSNTSSLGTALCQASFTRRTRSSTGRASKPGSAQAATCSGISSALAKLSQNTPPAK